MISYGAVTVINAIPCGIGAAVGIDLRTRADFKVCGTEHILKIVNDPEESTEMAEICVKNTFKYFHADEPEGWTLTVDSEIPISRGLKSSSSACNAIVSSVAERIFKENIASTGFSGTEMIKLGVRCAKEAGVTVTGAFDDACACHFGGFVMTDNISSEIMEKTSVEENDIILLVPEERIRKSSIDKQKFLAASGRMAEIVKTAKHDWYSALTKNGELIARIMNIDDSVASDALKMGAKAAGVSGTGPAISVVVGKGEGQTFLRDLDNKGYEAIVTRTR